MLKKIFAAALIGLMVFSQMSHAYSNGDKLPCGKIYQKAMLRGDTNTNAMNLAKNSTIKAGSAGSSSVNRTN